MTNKRQYRNYSKEFKEEALALITAQELNLYRCCKTLFKASRSSGN